MAPLPTGALSPDAFEDKVHDTSRFNAHGSPLENCIASTSIFRKMQ